MGNAAGRLREKMPRSDSPEQDAIRACAVQQPCKQMAQQMAMQGRLTVGVTVGLRSRPGWYTAWALCPPFLSRFEKTREKLYSIDREDLNRLKNAYKAPQICEKGDGSTEREIPSQYKRVEDILRVDRMKRSS